MMRSINQAQAQILATYVNSIRPEWGIAGILAAMRKQPVRSIEDLTIAAVRVACDPKAKTPELIALDGPHWDLKPVRERAGQPPACDRHPDQRSTRCRTCEAEAIPMPDTFSKFKAAFSNRRNSEDRNTR